MKISVSELPRFIVGKVMVILHSHPRTGFTDRLAITLAPPHFGVKQSARQMTRQTRAVQEPLT